MALNLVVVTEWYPAVGRPSRGRFIADQVDALVATGRVRPVVAAFDRVGTDGGLVSRRLQASRLPNSFARVLDTHPETLHVLPSGLGGAVPVARVPVVVKRPDPDRSSDDEQYARSLDGLAGRLRREVCADGSRPVGIVHAHPGLPPGYAAIRIAQVLGWPLVVTEHASYVERFLADPVRRRDYEAAASAASDVVAVSATMADRLRSTLPQLAGRISVIPNAVPVDAFPMVEWRARDPDELLYVGNRRPSKGIETLIRALAEIRVHRPSVRLTMIGPSRPEDDARWELLATELGLSAAVRMEPAAPRAIVLAAMSRAALFVHPSPSETFGVVAAEAISTGLPVVTLDSGGVTEVLGPDPDRFGAIAAGSDPSQLALAVVSAMARRSDFDPRAMHAAMGERFGADHVAARLIELYQAATEGRFAEGVPTGTSAKPGHHTVTTGGRVVILIALDRRRAERAATAIPDAVRRRVALITRDSGEPAVGGSLDGFRRLIELPHEQRPRLPVRLVRRLRYLDRASRRGGADDRLVTRAAQAAERLAGELAASGGSGPTDVVGLTALDCLAAHRVRGHGLRPAPGGLDWLGDHLAVGPQDGA